MAKRDLMAGAAAVADGPAPVDQQADEVAIDRAAARDGLAAGHKRTDLLVQSPTGERVIMDVAIVHVPRGELGPQLMQKIEETKLSSYCVRRGQHVTAAGDRMIPFVMSTTNGLSARASAFLWELAALQHGRLQRHPQQLRERCRSALDDYFSMSRDLGRTLAEGQARVVAAAGLRAWLC